MYRTITLFLHFHNKKNEVCVFLVIYASEMCWPIVSGGLRNICLHFLIWENEFLIWFTLKTIGVFNNCICPSNNTKSKKKLTLHLLAYVLIKIVLISVICIHLKLWVVVTRHTERGSNLIQLIFAFKHKSTSHHIYFTVMSSAVFHG